MPASVPEDALRVMPDPLREFTTAVFQSVGLPNADAELIARYLVEVDLRGVSSHGTRQLRRYVPEFLERRINPTPEIRQVSESSVSVVFDGDGGAGYLAATRATETVIARAKAMGIAMSATRNHGHVGSEGIYARQALAHDLVTFSVAGGTGWGKTKNPDATVWDAMQAPPMCFGIPVSEGPPFVLDMNVNMLPDRSRLEEALQTFPDFIFKSLGLKFVSTLLGGMLAGAVEAGTRTFSGATRGFLMVAIDPSQIGDLEVFKNEVARISAESRSLSPMPGLPSAELPGSLEWQRERDWAISGIPLTDMHIELLTRIAEDLNLTVPWEK